MIAVFHPKFHHRSSLICKLVEYFGHSGNASIITSDSIPAGDNTATVSENGVTINGSSQGIYFDNPASHTTDVNGNDLNNNPINLTGSGAFRNFSFNINGNCSGTCLSSGSWSYTAL